MPTKVTEILDRAARQCSVTPPSLWTSATTLTAKELRDDFMLETVDDIQRRLDWPAPIAKQTAIAGDGSAEYDLPTNFVRLAGDFGAYETTTIRRWGVPVKSDGEWTHIQTLGTAGGARFYRVKGYDGDFSIEFYPALETGDSVTISYTSTVWAINGSTEKSVFSDEDDYCLFPRRLIEAGIVYRFRERKGVESQTAQANYEKTLASYASKNWGRGNITYGSREYTAPMRYPVPDYIPSS